ncbi:HIG1 domain family member 2A, mitochondrial [Pectinophora gossypiella]|uniref:HIG1 domain family member 2A, mitochondrial n=1 Tax=Pectinophora gossypiella TaxID=13191 RepID=UPI00214E3089|nr:HIG1 domain family member 2A, mitochondrial [Pectinophora gossypiella]
MANDEPSDLDWVQLRQEMGATHHVETTAEKFGRKFSENPFVPIGCLATASALAYGLWTFRTRNSRLSQQMMRLRIVAQGFTITALVVGVMMTAGRTK